MDEGARIMRICNACRYCEGYCAVFPAMERRTEFKESDLNYLANLCHNCGECLDACQYAPPHEFAVDVPKLLSEIRTASYWQYAWPSAQVGIAGTLVALIACIAGWWAFGVFTHGALVAAFGVVSLAVLALFGLGFLRFWRNSGEGLASFFNLDALMQAAKDAATLHYLGGARRWMHHLTFYGFALCFASTCTAAVYHYFLHWPAPYPFFSAPVLLGTSGGVMLAVGTAGLLMIRPKDMAFPSLLLLSAVSGLVLLAMRGTPYMPKLLATHLGIIFALFLTLPYGKFVHAIYRSAALVKYALEGQRGIHRS